MKSLKKGVALMTILSMLFACFSQQVKLVNADTFSDKIEIQDLRTPNSKTYQLSDGSKECVVYSEDIHYIDENGQLADIDCSIVEDCEKTRYKYKNAANSWNVWFAEYLSEDEAVLIQKENYSLSYKLIGGNNELSVQQTQFLSDRNSEYYREIIQDNRAVVYQDPIENVDIVYSVRGGEVKEDIVLKTRGQQKSFDFAVNCEGVSPFQEEKDIVFRDTNGKEVFRIGKLYVIDADGKYSEEVSTELVNENGNTIIRIAVSEEYLFADDTVYPVVIDPTITVTGASTTFDTCVDEQYPSSNYYSSQNLWTGGQTGNNTMRTYIKFTLPTGISASSVTFANLKLKRNQNAVPGVKAYRVTSSWSSSTVTWNNKPSYSTIGPTGACTSFSGDWYQMDATSLVKQWLNGTYTNYGFLLKEPTETNSNQKTRWYSSDAPSPNKPELVIRYGIASGIAQLVGVPASGHDHSTWVLSTASWLNSCAAVTSVTSRTSTPTIADITSCLDTNTNVVFISRSHGGVVYSGNTQIGTKILLNDSGLSFSSNSAMSGLNLSNMELAMFVACSTGVGGSSGANLPHVAVANGARSSIGFSSSVNCSKANAWTIDFCYLMKNGYSIQSACYLLKTSSSYSYLGYGLEDYVICGDSGLKLN